MKALPKILFAVTAVAALSVAYPAKANLITNPGFETGDFTGWTENGAVVTGTAFGVAPHSGNFQAEFLDSEGSLTQSVATTPGASYTIGFFLAASPAASHFSVLWGGGTLTSGFVSGFPYTEVTFKVTASTASTELAFNWDTRPVGVLFLDDVSVTPGVGVPDGGSTVSLLGCALLGLAALRRKLAR